MDTPKVITKELAEALLLLNTEHDRTSCSDDNVTNGYGSSGECWPRCNRCLLLDVVRGEIPEGAEALLVDFQLQYKTPNAELRGAEPIGEASRSNDVLGAEAPERN